MSRSKASKSRSRKPRAQSSAQAAAQRAWPASKVELWDVKRLVPYARNARTHNEKQIQQLVASIKEWGFTTAVLVDEKGGIIAGHGRVLAAKKLGLKQVPIMVAQGWSADQKRAYLLADNKLPLNAGWDQLSLGAELQELKDAGADKLVKLIGFTDKELAKFFPAGDDITAPELTASFQILIECSDEGQQVQLLERLQKEGVACRALIA